MPSPRPALLTRRIHLTAECVSLLLDVTDSRVPAAVHWGSALGALTEADASAMARGAAPGLPANAPDVPLRLGILPQNADTWTGRPGLVGAFSDGSGFSTSFVTRAVTLDGAFVDAEFTQTSAGLVSFDLTEPDLHLDLRLDVELLPSGLVRTRAELTNRADLRYDLDALSLALPVPLDATEILDFAGRWGKERTPQRTPLTVGTHLREGRHGRTGPDSAYVLHVGTPGFGFRSGQIWAVHTAFSGNHVHYAEKTMYGSEVIGGGELLLPGEGSLATGASYASPWIYASHSADGLDTVAHRFHRYLRTRDQHGGLPAVTAHRPVTLNVWEAVYFDHDLARLTDLADRAAAVGVERYVLDDGWFGSRRDDHSGLGDWTVAPDVWPDGLGPLVDHVRGLGMQFGLWFEPEMVNEDSDVARAHPEWIMAPGPHRLPYESRHQQVLNLAIPEAWEHVHSQMDALLRAYDIGYIKWDHNRDLIEAGDRTTGRAATHAQTLATYRLFDTLKQDHPGLEIESCSSGGSRVDLGILDRADRIWISDNIDPLDRAQMNRWTSQLIPYEFMGSHVASGRSHTTGRLHTLSFRAGIALFGHFGIEWDLARATDEELTELKDWIAYFKLHRENMFTSDLVRADRGEDTLWLTGLVTPDKTRALFTLAAIGRSDVSPRGRLRLPGLQLDRRYRVTTRLVGPAPQGLVLPRWSAEPIELPGSVLENSGLAAPMMNPETVVLLEVSAIEG